MGRQKSVSRHHIVYCRHVFSGFYFPRGNLICHLQDTEHGLLHLQLDALAVGSQSNPTSITIPPTILATIDARYQDVLNGRGKNRNGGGRLYDRILFYEDLIEGQMYSRPHPALVTHLISIRAQREWLVLHGAIKR